MATPRRQWAQEGHSLAIAPQPRDEVVAGRRAAQIGVRWKFWKERLGVGPRCPWYREPYLSEP